MRKKSKAGKKTTLKTSGALIPAESDSLVHPNLKTNFCYCFYKAAARMRVLLDARLQPLGLIAPQLGLLRLLNDFTLLSQVELGAQMGIDKATMVKLIDSLEKQKLVTRKSDSKDRRVKIIQMTAQGKKMLDKAAQVRESVESELLSGLDKEERDVLRVAIPKLLKVPIS
jgi:DNA-binding MarR family transcriptional regulator